MNTLTETVAQLMQNPKGILAADESQTSANKRLASRGLPEDEPTRRAWRDLLLSTPDLEKFISGVILHDETIKQNALDGTPFPELLRSKNIAVGIKVDLGLVDNPDTPHETITKGIDDLAVRLDAYQPFRPVFAKWRATFTIDDALALPTDADIEADATILARYAGICQEHSIVPIVEPEVIFEGNHTIEKCEEVTLKVLTKVFAALLNERIQLPGLILKTGMVLAGSKESQSFPENVGKATLRVLNTAVPTETGGVVFLSGGQSPLQATENLQAVGGAGQQPWPITFSYSRAVQDPVMDIWINNTGNIDRAQAMFLHRLKMNALAREGKYESGMEERESA